MYDIIELNAKKVLELKEIAKKLGISRLEKLKKQLQYKIKVYPQVWLEILQWRDHDTQPSQPRLNDQWYFDIYSL